MSVLNLMARRKNGIVEIQTTLAQCHHCKETDAGRLTQAWDFSA